jgi:hypothetical protein
MRNSIKHFQNSYLIRFIILCCLAFSIGFVASAQETSILATVDTNKLLIGDQTYFRITVLNRTGVTIEWPIISDSLIKGIEIVKRFLPDTLSKQQNSIKIQQKFLITSFDSGQHNLPAIKIALTSGLKQDTVTTNPVSLWVSNMPVDTSKAIFDIKKPYGAPVTFIELIPYIAIGIGILLFILLLIYIIRRFNKQKPLLPTRKINEPAHITALRNLDLLKEEKLWQQGLVKLYYTKLTDIIRIYIEQRFEVPAMEQTSDEILASFKNMAIEDEMCFIALKEIVTLADLVKFAKALPLPNENESNILNAYLFINHSKAVEPSAKTLNEISAVASEGKEVSHE